MLLMEKRASWSASKVCYLPKLLNTQPTINWISFAGIVSFQLSLSHNLVPTAHHSMHHKRQSMQCGWIQSILHNSPILDQTTPQWLREYLYFTNYRIMIENKLKFSTYFKYQCFFHVFLPELTSAFQWFVFLPSGLSRRKKVTPAVHCQIDLLHPWYQSLRFPSSGSHPYPRRDSLSMGRHLS